MKILIPFFIAIFCISPAFAQKDMVEKGDKFYSRKDYENALKTYLTAYEADPENPEVNFKVGLTYLYTDAKVKAISYLEKAYRIKPQVDLDIDYHLGVAYQNNHEYAKAKMYYERFAKENKKLATIANTKILECIIGDSLSHHPIHVRIENAGAPVNSPFHEYSPLLSADGRTMIFTSNRSDDESKVNASTNYEDILITHKNGSTWSPPQKISPNINIRFNDAAASISPDGNTLFLYYEEGAGDIYISRKESGDWSKPEPLNKNINTPLFWETSACISADGQKLFFTSNRPGGKGELDIYVSELDSKGSWGKGVNLGPAINTPGHEDSPFIHSDGVTLYFSSDGHPSMGSNDIFKSEFKDGKWQKPVNLGYPINSIEYDGFFTLSEDKKTGYYSAQREDGMGKSDIYAVTFLEPKKADPGVLAGTTETVVSEPVVTRTEPVTEPVVTTTEKETVAVITEKPPEVIIEKSADKTPEEVKSGGTAVVVHDDDFEHAVVQLHKDLNIVTVLKGRVIDEQTAAPLDAIISLVNNETNELIARIKSDRATGDFELTIPHGGNYGVATERPGYLFNSINFNVPQFAEYKEIDTHIIMVKAEVGSKVVLKNVFFDIGKADLKAESITEVEKLVALLQREPQMRVQVNGHTDNTGNAAANKLLSLRRATSVMNYLASHGVDSNRVTAKGFGSERPIVSNDDEQSGREINRRTEIEIIE